MHFIPLLTLPISLQPFAPVHQPGVKAPTPFARLRPSPGHQPTTRYQGSIKAKTPAIKANRASSRHIKARPEMINWGSRQPSPMWSAGTCRRFGTGRHVSQFPSTVMPAPSPLLPPTVRQIPDPGRVNQASIKAKKPLIVHDQGSIKAKTPAIKANRASSRQTAFFSLESNAPAPARAPFTPALDVGCSGLVAGCFPIFRPRHPNSRLARLKILFSSPVKYGHLWSHNDSSDSYY